jgi:hypothetical protein
MMALIGAGAVTGAVLLPRLQRIASADATVRIGTAGTALALILMALAQIPMALLAAAFIGGMSWIAVITSFNVSAQTALPNWIRARGLAVFLMVFFGSMALGSILWGQVAAATSIATALFIAVVGLGLGVVLTRKLHVGQGDALDHSPASVWPEAPTHAEDQSEDQPAMVIVEYRIRAEDAVVFQSKMKAATKERLRNGATRCYIHQSVEEPGVWVETFHLGSWAEHLEQHGRVSVADMHLHKDLRTLHQGPGAPVVRHYIGSR